MNRLVFSWIAGVAAALLAPPASAQGTPPPPDASRAADPAIWETKAAGGAVVHRASGVALPPELAGLARGRLAAVGPEDVAAGYSVKEGAGGTDATVYLFKPASLAEHKLKGSVEAFGILNPKAFLWSAGPFDIAARPRSTPGRACSRPDRPRYGDGLSLFRRSGTLDSQGPRHPQGVKEPAQEARIDAWSPLCPGADPRGQWRVRGPACKAPRSTPSGATFRNQARTASCTKMEFKPKEEAKLPVVGQADVSMFGKADIRHSDQGELVYVVAVPEFFTYRLILLPPPVTELFTKGFGALSIDKPVYAMVVKVGPSGLMPRLYNGKPTAEAFGAALDGMVFEELKEFQPVADFAKTLPD